MPFKSLENDNLSRPFEGYMVECQLGDALFTCSVSFNCEVVATIGGF